MGGIYLIQSDDQLVEMTEEAYNSEELLQILLAKYPSILAGDQMNPEHPRRWLLVRREMGVPINEGGTDWFALDHLFLDQDGIPTLVEVKRAVDTRSRREVVAQMLDYAANAVVYWPIETIRAEFAVSRTDSGLEPSKVISKFLGDADEDDFWQKTKTNLQAGRVRMIFVADTIQPELRRIVEFLNGQMNPAEVLAVEVKQYVGGALKTLVPRVIGLTAHAQIKKGQATTVRQWDEETFLKELEERVGVEGRSTAKLMLKWADQQNLRVWWGRGAQSGSFYPMLDCNGASRHTFAVWTGGGVQLQFPHYLEGFRAEVARRISAIPGTDLPEVGTAKYPSFGLNVLKDESLLKEFLETFDWMIGEIRVS